MIKKIKIISRSQLNIFSEMGTVEPGPWFLISVYTDNPVAEPKKKDLAARGCVDFISIQFGDFAITRDFKGTKFEGAKFFDEDLARQVLNFSVYINNSEVETLYVQCDAGVSRSGAIGTFLCDFYGLDFFEFKRENPHILPNPMVLSMLMDLGMEEFNSSFQKKPYRPL